MELFPDRRHYTKQWIVFATLTLFLAVAGGIATAVIAIVGEDTGQAIPLLWIVLGAVNAATWLIAAPIVYLWIKNLSYRIEQDKVIINKGILTKTQQNIPLRMVTDFRLQRTLYDRWLEIGSILVQTAGQAQTAPGFEGKLAGLKDWGSLHDELQNLVREYDWRQGTSETHGVSAELGGDDIDELVEDVHAIRQYLEQMTS